MNRVSAVEKCVLRDVNLSWNYAFKTKTGNFTKKKISECDEYHFPSITKTAKYFENFEIF